MDTAEVVLPDDESYLMQDLRGAEIDVLHQLFKNGPTWDGNIISKTGRDDLYERKLIDRYDGWQWLTRLGVLESIARGYDRQKQ
jgi:hypothetical protein